MILLSRSKSFYLKCPLRCEYFYLTKEYHFYSGKKYFLKLFFIPAQQIIHFRKINSTLTFKYSPCFLCNSYFESTCVLVTVFAARKMQCLRCQLLTSSLLASYFKQTVRLCCTFFNKHRLEVLFTLFDCTFLLLAMSVVINGYLT